jgi:hypothetical protein
LTLLLVSRAVPLPAASFVRGDVNHDGAVDLSDPIRTLMILFQGNPDALDCPDAADTNDDGAIDIADPITTLSYLFAGAAAPPPPGPRSCGEDPTQDALTCPSFAACDTALRAEVTAVSTTGSPGAYTFLVTVKSPDTGCERYADWWEVLTPEGTLLYRRILLHSHTTEQPFTRSGGPVPITADTEVIVRAHMNTSGYGTHAFQGTPAGGFSPTQLEPAFAVELAEQPPLPTSCAF